MPSERVINRVRVPVAAGRASVLEIEIVEHEPPGRWRLRFAMWLIKIAGRLARIRVRIVREQPVARDWIREQ